MKKDKKHPYLQLLTIVSLVISIIETFINLSVDFTKITIFFSFLCLIPYMFVLLIYFLSDNINEISKAVKIFSTVFIFIIIFIQIFIFGILTFLNFSMNK